MGGWRKLWAALLLITALGGDVGILGAMPGPGDLRAEWQATFEELLRIGEGHRDALDTRFFVQLARAAYHTKRLHQGVDALERAIALSTARSGESTNAEVIEYTSMICDLHYHMSRENATALRHAVGCLQRQFKLDKASAKSRLGQDSNYWRSYSGVLAELGRWNSSIAAVERSAELATRHALVAEFAPHRGRLGTASSEKGRNGGNRPAGALQKLFRVAVAAALGTLQGAPKSASVTGRPDDDCSEIEASATGAAKAADATLRLLLVGWRGRQKLAKALLMAKRFEDTLRVLRGGGLSNDAPAAERGWGSSGLGHRSKWVANSLLDDWRDIAELSPQGFSGMRHDYDEQANLAIAAERRRHHEEEADGVTKSHVREDPHENMGVHRDGPQASSGVATTFRRKQHRNQEETCGAQPGGLDLCDAFFCGSASDLAPIRIANAIKTALVAALASEDLLWIADAWHDAGLAHLQLRRFDEALYSVQVRPNMDISLATPSDLTNLESFALLLAGRAPALPGRALFALGELPPDARENISRVGTTGSRSGIFVGCDGARRVFAITNAPNVQAALWGIADLHHPTTYPSSFLRRGFTAAVSFFERTGQVLSYHSIQNQRCTQYEADVQRVPGCSSSMSPSSPPLPPWPQQAYAANDPYSLLRRDVGPADEIRLQQLAVTALGDPGRYFLLAELNSQRETKNRGTIAGGKCLWARALRVPDGDANWLEPEPFFVPPPLDTGGRIKNDRQSNMCPAKFPALPNTADGSYRPWLDRSLEPNSAPSGNDFEDRAHGGSLIRGAQSADALIIDEEPCLPNAAVVYLCCGDEQEVRDLELSLALTAKFFTSRWRYPVLILHDYLSGRHMARLKRLARRWLPLSTRERRRETAALTFVFLNSAEWHGAVPADVNTEDKIFGYGMGYRHMCRFFSGPPLANLPALRHYHWVARVDTDSFLLGPVLDDPIQLMERGCFKYGWLGAFMDQAYFTTDLWPRTEEWIHSNELWNHVPSGPSRRSSSSSISSPKFDAHNPSEGHEPNGAVRNAVRPRSRPATAFQSMHDWIARQLTIFRPDDPSNGTWDDVRYCFATNFFVADLNWWRGEEYGSYFEHLDNTGGFYRYRWGDACVHFLAAAALLEKDVEVVRFPELIRYWHQGSVLIPEQRGLFSHGNY